MKALKVIVRTAAILGVIVSTFGLYYYTHSSDNLTVSSYVYESSKYTGSKDLKIIVLSDFHNHSLKYANKELLPAIDEQQPDLIFCTGDFIDNHTKDYSMLESMVSHWEEKKIPFYFVEGNHEMYAPEKISAKALQIFKDHGGYYLSESRLELQNNVVLSGIRDPGKNHDDGPYLVNNVGDVPAQLKKLESGFSSTKLNIMLCHRPDLFNLIYRKGYDLTFSGHTHGGQILMGKMPLAVYPWTEYVGGRYERENSTMIVSRGLGNSYNLPVRYRCDCEIVVVTIKSKA